MYFHDNTHIVLKSDEKEGVKSDFLKKKMVFLKFGKMGPEFQKD